MPRYGRYTAWNTLRALALIATVAIAAGCGGGSDTVASVTPPPPAPAAVATVVVTPGTSTIIVGASTQLSAETRSATGAVLTGRSVAWSSSNVSVATVSPGGLVTGVSAGGPVTISATSEGVAGVATATISPKPVGSITVTPSPAQVFIGATAQLTATVLATDGSTLTGRMVAWSSSNSAIASVSQTGVITGVSAGGPITVTAASEGVSATVNVTVSAVPVASVTITSLNSTMIVGAAMPLTVTTLDAAGRVLTGRVASWSSSNNAIATVSSAGVVTGVGAGGPVTITATSEGRSGTTGLTIVPGVLTGITNLRGFLDRCPTSDPAFATIRGDFEIRVEGVLVAEPTCTDPMSTMPIASITDELTARQVLRTAYYMSMGTEGKLPWTAKSLYDWMKGNISGVNIKTAPGQLYCCDVINGKRYFSTSRQDASTRDLDRNWLGISGKVSFYAHEIRHADVGAPGHVNGCPAFPLPTDPVGCDPSYNVANLGAYGVQYWLAASWATGFLYIGMTCAPPATVAVDFNWTVGLAEGSRNRFVSNPPPTVTGATPYGGPCLAF